MNANRLNTWLSFTANLGVILGLIFLAVELSQNSELMRIQISQSRADAAMDANEPSFNSDYVPKILVKVNGGEDLSAEEVFRYGAWFRFVNRNQDNILQQHYAGMMLSNTTPRSVRGFAVAVVASSEFSRQVWEIQKPTYSDEYVAFVDEVVREIEIQQEQVKFQGSFEQE